MKIVLAGGSSAGPIVPLLAVLKELRKREPNTRALLINPRQGVGHLIAEKAKVPDRTIVSGKLRRYFSLRNIFAPFGVLIGFIQSLSILRSFRPNIAIGGGGFVQVPVLWAAWFLGIPVLIHQQDVLPSLANSLCAPIASKITVCFENSERDFPSGSGLFHPKRTKKIIWTGNPFREDMKEATKAEGQKHFNLDKDYPAIVIMGGGGGAQKLNDLIYEALPELTKAVEVIHSTGPGKQKVPAGYHYHPYEFINRMDLAYAATDIFIGRAGLSTLTELANLGKVAIIIPIPGTHQEYNAQFVLDNYAALVLDQNEASPHELVGIIRQLLMDADMQSLLKKNIKAIMPLHGEKKIADEIIALAELKSKSKHAAKHAKS